jgi:Bifunctional DNA primase/polymerase, N-terminal
VSTRDEMLRAALAYAAAGLRPFPCKPGSKEPATLHGFKDGSNNPKRIRAWWDANPAYNPAIPTGTPGRDVLDVDARPDGSGWPAFNRLKRAGLLAGALALVRTRSGGLHVHFAGTDQSCGRLPRHHLDFKAVSGYVLMPPSFVEADENGPAGSYECLDHRAGTGTLDWAAVRLLLAPPCSSTPRRPAADGDCTRLVEWVARQAQPHDRHGPLLWAAHRFLEAGQLDEAAVADLVAASVRAGHDERDARSCVESVLRKGAVR